jgi:hypothetical protein
VVNLRILLSEFTGKGDSSASVELARLDEPDGSPGEDKDLLGLSKAADAARKSYREMEIAREQFIISALANSDTFAWALRYCKERAAEEEMRGRHSADMVLLGRLYGAHGDTEAAKAILFKAINFLDDDGYFEGKIPALVALVDAFNQVGLAAEAERVWKFGLELDGTISIPWSVLDQMPSDPRQDWGTSTTRC